MSIWQRAKWTYSNIGPETYVVIMYTVGQIKFEHILSFNNLLPIAPAWFIFCRDDMLISSYWNVNFFGKKLARAILTEFFLKWCIHLRCKMKWIHIELWKHVFCVAKLREMLRGKRGCQQLSHSKTMFSLQVTHAKKNLTSICAIWSSMDLSVILMRCKW